jgi:uncharacterized protein (TIGR01777 family)
MRVVITGGTGFLGGALVGRLRGDGHAVTVLTRGSSGAGAVHWNPETPSTEWMSTLDGADGVINLAGESIAGGRWTPRRKALIRDSRVHSTRAVVTAIRAASRPPAVFISGSAMGIYGSQGDQPLTEDSPPGSDFLATVCVEWEREALAATALTRVVLVRTGLALGRSGGALPQIALPFYFFAGGPIGSGRQYMSWIHRDDWVEMVRWALSNPAVSGPLNATAPNPVTNREFAQTLGRVLRRPSFMPTPALPLRLALGEMADALLLAGQRVLPAVAESVGFTFRYPLLEPALRQSLEPRA